MLAGLCLSAVLQLLTVCRAHCVTKAFQLRRLSSMPCTATASWERRLARTVQVWGVLLLCVSSVCLSRFPVTCGQVLQCCPSQDIWCMVWHVGRLVQSALFHLQASQEGGIGGSCVSSSLLHRDIFSLVNFVIHHIINPLESVSKLNITQGSSPGCFKQYS